MGQLIGIVISLAALGVWAIVNSANRAASRRAQQNFIPPPQPPYCGTCGSPGMWNQQYNLYGCNRCQKWIETTTAQPRTVGGLPMQPPIR
jgi:hypothetical protein